MRRGVVVAALILGAAAGYSATVIVAGPSTVPPADTPAARPTTTRRVAATEPTFATSTVADSTSTSQAGPTTYLVWSTGGLSADLVAGLRGLFDQVSIVKGDVVELAQTGGWVIPLDALAIDPVDHDPFDPNGDLDALRPGSVILGATSARLRNARVGDTLTLNGTPFEVAGIAPDAVSAAAEVMFDQADPNLPISTDRYALVASDLARDRLERRIRSLNDGPAPLRIRSAQETPWLRHGDAVLPQVFIKEALGEFAYTNRNGSTFEEDSTFTDHNIITTYVPIVGQITCHRTLTEMLTGAFNDLKEEGLAHLIDPAGSAGCWYPRLVRTVTGTPAGLSRHSWGAAVDINAPTNQFGSTGDQDPRLVEIMQKWGFTWGGDWIVPDPMHFEYGKQP